MTVNIVRSTLVLAAAILSLVACSSSEDDASAPSPPAPGLQYATKDLTGPFESVEFETGGRYIATRRPCGAASCDAVEEQGTYELRGSEIVFVDDATHTPRSMAYSAAASADDSTSLTKALAPATLTEGSTSLVGDSSELVKKQVKLTDKSYALVTCIGGSGICSFIGCSGRKRLGSPGAGECMGGASSCCSFGPG